jgi:hypothetical protein
MGEGWGEGVILPFGSPSPFSPEAVKKLLQVERAGRDIGKVLQRYIFALTPHDEKLQ